MKYMNRILSLSNYNTRSVCGLYTCKYRYALFKDEM